MHKVPQKQSLTGKLYCSVFGHNFQVSKKITYHVKEYQCCHCKKEMTTNSKGNLTELTPKYKEINYVLKRIHKSKQKRFAAQALKNTPLKLSS